jgi:hypothetical protein
MFMQLPAFSPLDRRAVVNSSALLSFAIASCIGSANALEFEHHREVCSVSGEVMLSQKGDSTILNVISGTPAIQSMRKLRSVAWLATPASSFKRVAALADAQDKDRTIRAYVLLALMPYYSKRTRLSLFPA